MCTAAEMQRTDSFHAVIKGLGKRREISCHVFTSMHLKAKKC